MRPFVRVGRGACALLIAVVLACGGSTDPGSGGGTPINPGGGGGGGGGSSAQTVTVSNNAFTPDNLIIAVGSSVTFRWNSCQGGGYGETCTPHTVTFSDGTTSETLSSGSYTRSFGVAGTYTYHCTIHGASMSGTIEAK
jgi:plastocyanin